MRRSSIVGPLLLIGIGALFLARNVFPEMPLLDYLARYWPVLLIAWGALRLGEILVWAASSKPLPRQGVSGPEWAMVVFLCFVGFSLHAVRGFTSWLPRSGITMGGLDMFGESWDYPLSGEKAVSKNPRVIVETFRGNARITGAEGETVKVTGHKSIRSLDQGGADRANQESPFEIAGDQNQVIIRTNQDRVPVSQRVSAELEITVPKGASLELHGRSGDFDVNDVSGSVEVTSDNAGVRLENIGGEVRIEVRRSDTVRATNVKGSLELKGRGGDIDLQNIEGQVNIDGNFSGVTMLHNLSKPLRFTTPFTEFSLEKLPGEVRLTLGDLTATNLTGPVRMSTTRSWDVHFNDFTNSIEVNLARGDIDLRPGLLPLAKMDARTHSGDIELALPAAAKFDLTASSNRGEVNNDFGAPLQYESSKRGGTLRGSNGGPPVTLHTDRGQVMVRRASASDRPAAPKAADSVSPKSIDSKDQKQMLKPVEQ